MRDFLRRESTVAFLAFTGVFAALVAYVFWGTWSQDVAFVQPDNSVVHAADEVSRRFRELFAGAGHFVPADLRLLLGGPYVWQELQYALAAYMAALGAAYYLRGRGVSPFVGFGAGAAYGLMGYNFTLFSAGHLGWFNLFACAPWAFALIDRGVRKGKWRNWALLGAVMAWASAWQADIWLLFAVLWTAYGLWRAAAAVRAAAPGVRLRRCGRILSGVALAAAVMFSVGLPQFRSALTDVVKGREEQLAQAGAIRSEGAADAAAEAAADEARWNFCVSWSLPPEDVLEFFVRDVHGASNDPRVSPKNPYRGRIGQRVVVKEGQRGVDPRTGKPVKPGDVLWLPYRQHSLYMGPFVVLLALFAAVAAIVPPLRRTLAASGGAGNRAETAFWTAAGAVALLCALGGFTPFYRIVYHLPYGSTMRCPLKFVHLVEWCVAALAGLGACALARRVRFGIWIAAGLLLVSAVQLAVNARNYVATDPMDCLRVEVARSTGSVSFQPVMDAATRPDASAEHVFASAQAMSGNAALKQMIGGGAYAPASYWTYAGGRFSRVPRERAAFVLFKSRASAPPPAPPIRGGGALGKVLVWISVLTTLGVSGAALSKLKGRRRGVGGRGTDGSGKGD